MFKRAVLGCLVSSIALGLCSSPAGAQCLEVLLVIGSSYRPVGSAQTLSAGAVVTYQESNGVKRLIGDPRVVFGHLSGTQVVSQAIGSASTVTVKGNIKKVPSSVVIEGQVPVLDQSGQSATAMLTLTVSQLKRVTTGKGAKAKTKLTGKTAFTLVDTLTGQVLASQPPLKLSRDREFEYHTKRSACAG